jgi:acyl-CoA hydrolase
MNPNRDLTPRPVRDSQSEMNEIVLPNDANPLNALLGGRLMHWIDLAGAMAAHRHSRSYVSPPPWITWISSSPCTSAIWSFCAPR